MFPEPAVRNGRKPERRTARARGKASRSSTRMPLTQRCLLRWSENSFWIPPVAAIFGAERSSSSTIGTDTSLGLLLFARYDGAQYTLVAVNTTGNEQTVPFWFPVGGDYREELHGGDLDLEGAPALKEHALTIPTHYGRIWTRASANPHASIPSPSFAPGNRFVRADPAKDPKKLGRARRT